MVSFMVQGIECYLLHDFECFLFYRNEYEVVMFEMGSKSV